MRRYDIVSGILLILSIIDFASAVPVVVQEKHQARVDVVHIPKDVITVLEKRGKEDELEKLWEKFLETGSLGDAGSDMEEPGILEWPGRPATYTLPGAPGPGPLEPNHGSTNIVQAPAPNRAPPTPPPNPGSTNIVQAPAPDRAPSTPTANPDSTWDFIPSYKGDDKPNWPPYTPASSGYDSDREFMEAHAPQPNRPLSSIDSDSSSGSLTDPYFDLTYGMDPEDSPLALAPPRPATAGESGQAHKSQVDQPSTSGRYAPSPREHEHEVVTPPSGESPDS